MSVIKKDKKFGIQAQLKSAKNPTFTGTNVRNMMDHAKAEGSHGINLYSTGNKVSMASGSKSKKLTLDKPSVR